MVHSAHHDAEGVKQRLLVIDEKCEDFMMRLDNRRKNLTLAINFFSLAKTVGRNSTITFCGEDNVFGKDVFQSSAIYIEVVFCALNKHCATLFFSSA